MVPDFMEVMEGDEFELCVNLSSPGSFERDVTLTFDLIPINAFASKLHYNYNNYYAYSVFDFLQESWI